MAKFVPNVRRKLLVLKHTLSIYYTMDILMLKETAAPEKQSTNNKAYFSMKCSFALFWTKFLLGTN